MIQWNIVYNTWEFTNSGVPHGCSKGHAGIPHHCDSGGNSKPPYATIRIKCVMALVNKEIRIIHNKQITLYFSINHVQLNIGYFPLTMVQNVWFQYSYNLLKTAIMLLWLNTRPIAWRTNHNLMMHETEL